MLRWKITMAMALAGVMTAGPAFAQATTGSAPASGGETKGEQPKGTPTQPDSAGQPPRPETTKSGRGASDSGMMKSSKSMGHGASHGHKGMGGQEHVKAAQQALKDKGHDPGGVDGRMGPRTQQAVRDFQKAQGLQATGRLDEKTMQSLGVEGARTSSARQSSPSASPSSGTGTAGQTKK